MQEKIKSLNAEILEIGIVDISEAANDTRIESRPWNSFFDTPIMKLSDLSFNVTRWMPVPWYPPLAQHSWDVRCGWVVPRTKVGNDISIELEILWNFVMLTEWFPLLSSRERICMSKMSRVMKTGGSVWSTKYYHKQRQMIVKLATSISHIIWCYWMLQVIDFFARLKWCVHKMWYLTLAGLNLYQ